MSTLNILDKVSTIMTKDLITVHPKDTLLDVKEIFDKNRIHHLPVVEFKKIVGIMSKADLMHYQRNYDQVPYKDVFEDSRLKAYKVGEVMTKGMATLSPDDRIDVALEVFRENILHAIPVVENGELVGLLTTHDIIEALAK
ncbi:MAG: CBS domain-containing protein [Saprospiraceae bacterium]|nr:CBS domain-containing protein [Saprospiraceae bacterium]